MRFFSVFVATFFLSIHYGIIVFANSSLLGGFFDNKVISSLFFLGAVGNTILFLFTPKLIERFGKRKLLVFFLFIALVSSLGMALATEGILTAISFVIHASVIYIIFYCIDIFLEELSKDSDTSEIRGGHIALIHLGFILGLLILSVLTSDGFKPAYTTAVFFLLPPIIMALTFIKTRLPNWHGLHRHHLLPYHTWWKVKSVRRATLARFTLEFFYAFMAIYTPLYLFSVIGFRWSVIGVMFAVMLLPFVFFQWPLGKLSDHFWGEKELMIVGFLFVIISLLLMPSLTLSIKAWIIVLFLSRIGASMVESMTDSFFFKHVTARNTGLLSIFRLTRPLSVVAGTITGALALNFFSFEKIFYVLAIVVFLGLKEALLIRDTL